MHMRPVVYIVLALAVIISGCVPGALRELREAEYKYHRGDARQLDRIIALLREDTPVSREAAYALGKLGDLRATQPLVETIEMRKTAARDAVKALGMLHDVRTVPVLIQVIKNDYPEAEDAVAVLGMLRDTRAVPVLLQVVEERRPYFVKAITALGEIGDKRAADLLIESLKRPPVDEPENVQFRVIQKDIRAGEEKLHMLTFGVPDNLPPGAAILERRIEPDGNVVFRYELKDAEYDTLSILPEYSTNGGASWRRASTEGKLAGITESGYRRNLVWLAARDNIPYKPETRLLFRLTPQDRFPRIRRGVPDIRSFNVDSTSIGVRDITREAVQDVPIVYFYPNPVRASVDSFAYQFSTDNGFTWLPATVRSGMTIQDASADSMRILWSSDIDLPHTDMDNVIFRVSENIHNTLGRFAVSNAFHVDNNAVPAVMFQEFNESDIFNIGYTVHDDEQDTVSLEISYSMDSGRSWRTATLSGDFSNLTPERYSGELRWFADFDITELRNNPLRLRIRPADRDPGQFVDSRDFFLKDADFSKLTRGIASGDVALTYPVAAGDSLPPKGEYSTDGGRTWHVASISDVQKRSFLNRENVTINWNFPHDIATNLQQIEAVGTALDKLEDASVVPALLEISLQKNSPSLLRRQQAVEARRLLEKKPGWIIRGLIASLIYPEPVVRNEALKILQWVDTPEANRAIADYRKFWADLSRDERETGALEKETGQQNYLRSIYSIPVPTEEEVVNFLLQKGMTRTKSEAFLKDLDVIKKRTALKEEFDAGRITYNEYMQKIEELVIEARERREKERQKAETKKIKKGGKP